MTDRLSADQKLPILLRFRRLHVCALCWWHLGHWPMNDLGDSEWAQQLEGETAWSAFLEGWCRE